MPGDSVPGAGELVVAGGAEAAAPPPAPTEQLRQPVTPPELARELAPQRPPPPRSQATDNSLETVRLKLEAMAVEQNNRRGGMALSLSSAELPPASRSPGQDRPPSPVPPHLTSPPAVTSPDTSLPAPPPPEPTVHHQHTVSDGDTLASDLAKVFATVQEPPNVPLPAPEQGEEVTVSQHDGPPSASVRSLEEVMGEPARRSTPVPSPDRPGAEGQQAAASRFAVLPVAERGGHCSRSRSISMEGRISPEAEHYDSSPSPGSCYDTASESVEPGSGAHDLPPHLAYSDPTLAPVAGPLPHYSVAGPLAGPLPHYSWPSWPPAEGRGGANRDDHHTSGDSIPVGCEASHLDTSQDSGLGPHSSQRHQQAAALAQEVMGTRPPNTSASGGFYPGPEATFMPVEPPKDPPLDVESVEDDHTEVTDEESFIQNALSMLDHRYVTPALLLSMQKQRHSSEMDLLQRKMEELQRHYMQEKETLRVDLVHTLLNTRKMEQEAIREGELDLQGVSPAMLQLQQQQQLIQQQINAQRRTEELQAVPPQLQGLVRESSSSLYSPSPAGQLLQPVPSRYYHLPAQHHPQPQPQLVTLANGQTVQLLQGLGQQLVALQGQQFFPVQQEQLLPPRPQSFAPPRLSPRLRGFTEQEREQEEERLALDRLDCASVMSEPARNPAAEQGNTRQRNDAAGRASSSLEPGVSLQLDPTWEMGKILRVVTWLGGAKRDSFSDSGAEGSGTNTPTRRGVTMTEGLLRFVQDGSVVRPLAEAQKRQMTEQGVPDRSLPGPGQAVVGPGQGGPGPGQGGPGPGQGAPGPGQGGQGPGLQMGPMQGAHGPAQGVAGPVQPAGPPGPHQQLATSASQPMAAQSSRHDMSQSGRFSALSNPSSFLSGHQGRDSAPLGREASVIQPVPGQEQAQYGSAASVIQPRYLPGPDYSLPPRPFLPMAPSPFQPAPHYLSYPSYSAHVAGRSLGSASQYGASPAYPPSALQPHNAPSPFIYPQFAASSQLSTFPPGPLAAHGYPPPAHHPPPSSSFQPIGQGAGGNTVPSLCQPIMSSNAQPTYPYTSTYSAMGQPTLMSYGPGLHPALLPQHYAPSYPLGLPTPSSPPAGLMEQGQAEGAMLQHIQQEGGVLGHLQEGGLAGPEEGALLLPRPRPPTPPHPVQQQHNGHNASFDSSLQ